MLHGTRLIKHLVIIVGLILTVAASAAAQSAPANSRADEPLIDQIIIKYRTVGAASQPLVVARATELKHLSEAAGTSLAYVREMSGDAHVLRAPQRQTVAEIGQLADRLATLPEIEYAVPDRILRPLLTPNDAQYGSQWHYFGTYGIDAPAAWDITTGSSSIVVAVIDTGILAHADLAGRTVAGYDFISNVFAANDGNGRDSDPSDPGDWVTASQCGYPHVAEDSSWHGTHVAGTIGAASNNSLGVAGINWNSRILPVRVLGKCGGTNSDIIDGMRWAAGLSVPGVPANLNPSKVINMSLGGPGTCDAAQQSAINDIVAAGTTVVVAAGNSNANASGFTPASCNSVISVASTNRTGNRAYYSNFGSVVDIAAPGGETNTTTSYGVLSTLNAGTTSPGADSYVFYQGTSMAAPHVAGVASLVLSLNPTLSPVQVSNILRGTVKAFPGGSSCNTSICGPGIANAFTAVNGLPHLNSVSPQAIPMGSVSVTLSITGANFVSGASVKWNGLNLPTTFINSTNVTAIVSDTLLSVPIPGNVTVSINHGTYGNLTTAPQQVTIQGGQQILLPIVLRNYPLVPGAPVLSPISNPAQANAYSVVWTGVSMATSYILQEDDNAAFSSPVTAYNGTNTFWNATGKPIGTYYYRVKASNANGDSGWSATQSTVVQSAVQPGIRGTITYQGNPIAGTNVELRFFDGSAYSSAGTTTTQADGSYVFTSAPGLGAGQSYYVRYGNSSAPSYLAVCGSPDIISYSAGANVSVGNMDIANIALTSPAPDAVVPLPQTFQWAVRSATASDSYWFFLEPDVSGTEYFEVAVGYAGSYNLTGLPGGFTTGEVYDWYTGVDGANGLGGTYFGLSYYYRTVTFSSGFAATTGPELPHTEADLNQIEARRLQYK